MSTFTEYLLRQSKRSDDIGALARAVQSDGYWPHRASSRETFETHVRQRHPTVENMLALRRAYYDWTWSKEHPEAAVGAPTQMGLFDAND